MATVQDIPTEDAFATTISALPASTLAVIYFHAPWAAPCKQMATVLSTLASTYPASSPLKFFSLDAEELPEVSEQYDVTAVPYIVLQRDGKTLETVSGGDAAKVRAAVERHANVGPKADLPPAQIVTPRPQDHVTSTTGASTAPPTAAHNHSAHGHDHAGHDHASHDHSHAEPEPETTKEELFKRLAELVKAAPVMLFMKGTPSAPQCGFSRQTVALLREKGIRYGFFNILADDEVRQGLKEYADWPTFPQVWVGGELVGGLDIVREEFENDEEFLKEYSVNSQS